MKKLSVSLLVMMIVVATSAISQLAAQKLVSNQSEISFFSHTTFEDIQANNYKSVSTINTETGDVVFSVPMQSFEFEKSLMQKHFNSKKFLNTKEHPKAKLKGKITNLNDINFSQDGTYSANVEGTMTIKGVSQKVKEVGTVIVSNGKVTIETEFDLHLPDYEVAFTKGKPSKNIAKTIKVNATAKY